MTSRRILLVRPDRVGDLMTASGLPAIIKKAIPGSYVGFLANKTAGALLQQNPWIDVLLTDTAPFLDLVKQIRSYRFDMAFLLVQKSRFAWMIRLSGIPLRFGIGGKFYEFLCGIRGLSRKDREIRHQSGADILLRAGISSANLRPQIFITEAEKINAIQSLKTLRVNDEMPLVGVQFSHGGSSFNWPMEQWMELVQILRNRNHSVFVHASGLPEFMLEKIKNQNQDAGWKIFSQCSLRELAALISQCDVFVSPNTGPLHMAAGLQVPAIGLYCPLPNLNPASWALAGEIPIVAPCNGCLKPALCRMDKITVQTVLEKIESVLGQKPNAKTILPKPDLV